MAQMQFLGTMPQEDKWSHLAEAMKGGVKGFQAGQKIGVAREELGLKRETLAAETRLKERELDISGKKADAYQSYVDLQKEEQTIARSEQRRKMFTSILTTMKDIPPDKQSQAWDVMADVLSQKGEMVGDAVRKMKGIIVSDATIKTLEDIEKEALAKERGKQTGYHEVWGEDRWFQGIVDAISDKIRGVKTPRKGGRYTVTPAE